MLSGRDGVSDFWVWVRFGFVMDAIAGIDMGCVLLSRSLGRLVVHKLWRRDGSAAVVAGMLAATELEKEHQKNVRFWNRFSITSLSVG